MLHSQPEGFLATPETGKGPGVLILHAWWGLNETMKEVCRRLALEGFVAFAPDLYHGQMATTIEEAEILGRRLDMKAEQARADIAAAVEFLSQRSELAGSRLGVIGFSLGAYYALRLSVDDPQRVAAVVLFYGTGDGDFQQAKAAYLGHFAESDEYEPAAQVDWLESELRAAGRPVTFYRYADSGHWFFEADRSDAHNQAAAQLAWERTVAFLRDVLSA